MEEETMEEQNKGKEQGKNHTAELPVAVLIGIITSRLPGFRHRILTIILACK